DKGTEGATYGLISTVNNLSGPFASILYKYINSYFKVRQNDIKSDTLEVRWDVAYVFMISYGCKVASLFWLFLLPPQKAEVQALKARGGKSKVAGVILVSTFVVCVSFTVTTSIMSIFPLTKCYRVAGGNGVLDPKTGNDHLVKYWAGVEPLNDSLSSILSDLIHSGILVGKEGSVYGQITTVNNLARPFAGIVYKYAASFFKMSQNDLKNVYDKDVASAVPAPTYTILDLVSVADDEVLLSSISDKECKSQPEPAPGTLVQKQLKRDINYRMQHNSNSPEQ
ncbi:hypothetical protein B5M09_013708, partial [Aphanomyces astaci]